jgi:hypothetical protein
MNRILGSITSLDLGVSEVIGPLPQIAPKKHVVS